MKLVITGSINSSINQFVDIRGRSTMFSGFVCKICIRFDIVKIRHKHSPFLN